MISVEQDLACAIVRFERGRGNTFDPPMVQACEKVFRDLSMNPRVHAVVLAARDAHTFSAGLDLDWLSAATRPELADFLTEFTGLVRGLYEFPKPVIAALEGHAVAGGFVVALTADVRILRENGARVGFNEGRIGIALPYAVTQLLRATLRPEAMARHVLLGENLTGAEAVRVGLVDTLAPAGTVEAAALRMAQDFAMRAPTGLQLTKTWLRSEAASAMAREAPAHLEAFLEVFFSPVVQERLAVLRRGRRP